MNNVLGIKDIRVEAIEAEKNDMTEVNAFLQQHDGSIIDIQIIPMFQGLARFIVTYRDTN